MQWIRSIFRSTRRLVGTDLDGNKYYEILRDSTVSTIDKVLLCKKEGRKARREVITNKNLKHEQYESGIIPTEWEAWLRGSSKEAPSHDDLIKKQRRQIVLSQKVLEINERDKKRQAEEYNDGLVARPLGHASSPLYGHTKETSHAQTTGKLFKPGVWEKQLKTKNDKDDSHEPESWKPP